MTIPEPHPYSNTPLVLITGVGRSGTTAVRESLGQHPDLHYTGRENNIIFDVLDTALRNCTMPSRRFAMRVDEETYDAAFRQLLLKLLWPGPRPEGCRRLLAYSGLRPELAEYLGRVFPGVRIIQVVRNGIEVVASRMRYAGFAQQPFEHQAAVWNETMHLARWGNDHDDFLLVRHEQLIATDGPQTEMARICQFLGLPEVSICAENLQQRDYHPTSDDESVTQMAPRGDRAERWRTWTAEQRAIFDMTCGTAMDYFGYQRPWHLASP